MVGQLTGYSSGISAASGGGERSTVSPGSEFGVNSIPPRGQWLVFVKNPVTLPLLKQTKTEKSTVVSSGHVVQLVGPQQLPFCLTTPLDETRVIGCSTVSM